MFNQLLYNDYFPWCIVLATCVWHKPRRWTPFMMWTNKEPLGFPPRYSGDALYEVWGLLLYSLVTGISHFYDLVKPFGSHFVYLLVNTDVKWLYVILFASYGIAFADAVLCPPLGLHHHHPLPIYLQRGIGFIQVSRNRGIVISICWHW